MKRVMLLMIVFFVSLLPLARAEDLYWVSFSKTDGIGGPRHANFSFVMQIDSLGKIRMPPTQIHNRTWDGPEITTLASADNSRIHVWVTFWGKDVRHGFITKSPFGVTRLTSLPISESAYNAQAPRTGGFLAMTPTRIIPPKRPARGLME